MLDEIKKIALMTAYDAGEILLKSFVRFDRGQVELKSTHEIVTKADKASEKSIINSIRTSFPDHDIISEEAGEIKGEGEYVWIVDPLDGTTNFSMHNPLFGISIAVARVGEQGKLDLIFGLVYAPYMKELFVAEKGEGARLITERDIRSIKVSNIKTSKVINAFCHSYRDADIKKAVKYNLEQKVHGFDCRQLGSASLELAYVASGRIESIYIPGANSWDVAAGALLVEEAGGRVTDEVGKKWTLDSKDIIASNGLVHKQVLGVIKKL